MECPKCNTWNPDDKVVCWRCQAELPKPKPQKKKQSGAFSSWMWVLVVVVFAATLLAQCLFMPTVLPGQ